MFEQRVHVETANRVVSVRHPGEWPPPGVDFAEAPEREYPVRLPNGDLLVPRRAESEAGTIGDGVVEIGPDDPEFATWSAPRCLHCGSPRLHYEERDSVATGAEPPPPESYGSWVVCEACGHEWPETNG